jgi:hypothetical protein
MRASISARFWMPAGSRLRIAIADAAKAQGNAGISGSVPSR